MALGHPLRRIRVALVTSRWRRAVAVLLCLNFAATGTAWFWLSHEDSASAAAQRAERAASRRAGTELEAKLCTTFSRLAVLQPPAGDPATNPSRAYLQGQHEQLVELGRDLGCKEGTS